jgi:hypothetical protein
VTLRLENGEALPFILDTGAPWTVFEKTQASKLGKCLDTGTFWNFGTKQEMGVYAAPKLYLGRTLLMMTGTNVATFDIEKLSSHGFPPFMGILGMDVLQHYCIQLDFAAGKVRFLNDERADKQDWGEPFSLTDLGNGCPVINENFVGAKGSGSEIDTGCDGDGWLTPTLFRQWTNQAQLPANGEARSPKGVLGRETYPELDLHETGDKSVLRNDSGVEFNGIGLHLLSRNLVTLDFPKQTMYLKRVRTWPLLDRDEEARIKPMGRSAINCMTKLKKKGRLPGWSKNDKVLDNEVTFHAHYPDSVILDIRKKNDPSSYHYELTRTSKEGAWKLQRAWRTDENDQTIEKYPAS